VDGIIEGNPIEDELSPASATSSLVAALSDPILFRAFFEDGEWLRRSSKVRVRGRATLLVSLEPLPARDCSVALESARRSRLSTRVSEGSSRSRLDEVGEAVADAVEDMVGSRSFVEASGVTVLIEASMELSG
jgi:hypothetical protein